MRIAQQSTIAASEQALAVLARAPAGERLKLPSNIRHLTGGAEAALAQVIITWAQRNPRSILETYIESTDQVDNFVRRLPGLVASICAGEAIGLGDIGSITAILRAAALERLELLQSERPRQGYRGSSAEIICADHIGRDAPYLLYLPERRGGSRLRPRENFRDLAGWLLRRAVPIEYLTQVPVDAPDAIGAMLFEVFKNTEEHALTDITGNLLETSIRAIKTNHHAMEPSKLAQISGDYPPLAKYCEALTVPDRAVYTHLFELSVLDSGPGFAATWTGVPINKLSASAEEAAVRACFGRGSTKKQSRFGEGLPHVLRLLRRQKGFLRLRTGRLSFFIDFSDGNQAEDRPLCRYNDTGDALLAPVAGSLLTILIPMQRA